MAENNRKTLLGLVAVGFFMQTLDSTIVNTALPAMAQSLGESPLRMQSVVISYSLVMAMLIPISGFLADRFGTKRTFFAAIVLFTLGSQLCAVSQTLNQLVLARLVQGMGGAMLLPIGRLAILQTVPRAEFLSAMSFVTIPGMVGPLIGPTLGGWLVQFASWHWIFLINIPIGMIGAVATLRYMPALRKPEPPPLDLSGFLLLAFSMVSISVALDGLAELGLRGAAVLVLLLFGLAALAAYWLHASRSENPLFPLTLFRVDTYRIGLLGNLFARIGSGAMPFLIPMLLQVGLNRTPFEAGMMMIPTAVAGMAAKRFGLRAIGRLGYRRVLVGNTLFVGLSMASFALLGPREPTWLRIVQLAAFGVLNSIQFMGMNTLTLKDLPSELASSGNGFLSMVQMLSMSLGVAAAGGLLAAFSRTQGVTTGAPLLDAFHLTFVCVGLITMASAFIFWQLPRETSLRAAAEESEMELAG